MPGPHKFFFGNSGAEAIECCMKLARYHTRRQHIIAFLGAFHGRTMGALSLTASRPQQRRRFAPLVPGVTHAPYPKTEADAPACARFIEETLFRSMLPPEEVAGIVIEPIQGEGGYIVAPSVFLRDIRRICDRHGILMIVDEVQSGAGRTGRWWAIEHAGVQPDLVASAKGIASGMPLGICIAKAEIMDWEPGSHGSTFGGNPVSIAAALATMNILEREAIANSAAVGDHMRERMDAWPAAYPIVREIRGRGLMIGVEVAHGRDAIIERAFERGLLCLGAGESAIRLTPPLIVSKEQADIAMDIFEQCIQSV
jgi:4-aminobutyrate aminotransferase